MVAVSACLGTVVAYAAKRSDGRHAGLAGSQKVKVSPGTGAGAGVGAEPASRRGEERPPRVRFIEYPEDTTAGDPQFRFHVPPRAQRPLPAAPGPPGEPALPRRFQCRLDDGDWAACSSPHRLVGLAPGDHLFAVRAFTREGRPGPAISHSWQQVERPPQREAELVDPRPFSIELQDGAAEGLYPGHPARQLPVRINNPNSVAIEVTSLTVAIDSGTSQCPPENFELVSSGASPQVPLVVPAGGSVSLPSPTVAAPSIRMLDLPVNQDACRGAEIPLVFDGEAYG